MFQPTFARLIPSLGRLADVVPRNNPHLILLLVCDGSSLSDTSIQGALKPVFDLADGGGVELGVHADLGLVYLCTWGLDCERIHDLADQLTLYQLGDDLVMTTWHDKESLKEAVWYLINCAEPANDSYLDTCDQVAVAVGNVSWYQQIEVALQELKCAFAA